MNEKNQRFERFLREFHPRAPRDLPVSGNVVPVSTRRFAAAAIVTISLATSVWFLLRAPHQTRLAGSDQSAAPAKQPVRGPLSTIALTRLALQSPAGLDAALAVTQQDRLPRFDRQDSVLRVLAQE